MLPSLEQARDRGCSVVLLEELLGLRIRPANDLDPFESLQLCFPLWRQE